LAKQLQGYLNENAVILYQSVSNILDVLNKTSNSILFFTSAKYSKTTYNLQIEIPMPSCIHIKFTVLLFGFDKIIKLPAKHIN